MADTDLPVWSIPPNWSTPVVERLEWLTDVLGSRSMAEQRRGLRLTPRRFFEFTVNPTDRVRSMLDQWLHRVSGTAFMLPIWHDKGVLIATAAATASRLEVDTRWLEFTDGGMAVVYLNPFQYEVVEIDSIDSTGLDLVAPLVGDWLAGMPVYPLKRAWMDPESRLSNLTSRVGEATLGFMLDTSNSLVLDEDTREAYDGFPVMGLEPNRLDALEQQFSRVMDELDNQTGVIARYDENTRSQQVQFYNWTAHGRQAHHDLRQTLYRLAGRQKSVLMPSFNRDVVLAATAPSGQTYIDIDTINYHLFGGPISGRQYLRIKDAMGVDRTVKVTGSAVVSEDIERLTLSEPLTFNLADQAHGSFAEIVRLDQDAVEIVHHTDSAGACEASAAFKAVPESRVLPALLIADTVQADMSDVPCGVSDLNPCPIYITHFDGWDYEFSVIRSFTKRRATRGFYIHRPVDYGGDAGGGNAFGGRLGSDFSIFGQLAAQMPFTRWDARRVLLRESQRPYSMVGDWRCTMEQGIVNRYGTPKSQLNYMTIKLYARHWSEPFPGRLVYTKVTSSSATRTVKAPQIIDWRDFR